MEIFSLTLEYPKEETYSLTDQIRRSSRSVTANLAESWAKRKYIKVFVNKLTDSLGETLETENWLSYSKDCGYINQKIYDDLISQYDEVRKMLISMINNPNKFCT